MLRKVRSVTQFSIKTLANLRFTALNCSIAAKIGGSEFR